MTEQAGRKIHIPPSQWRGFDNLHQFATEIRIRRQRGHILVPGDNPDKHIIGQVDFGLDGDPEGAALEYLYLPARHLYEQLSRDTIALVARTLYAHATVIPLPEE